MAIVASILLNHVNHDPPQAWLLATFSGPAGERIEIGDSRYCFSSPLTCLLPLHENLLRRVTVEVRPVQARCLRRSEDPVPIPVEQHRFKPVVLDIRHVAEETEECHHGGWAGGALELLFREARALPFEGLTVVLKKGIEHLSLGAARWGLGSLRLGHWSTFRFSSSSQVPGSAPTIE